MEKDNEILNEFSSKVPIYEGFMNRMCSLISDLLKVNEFNTHYITSRVKDRISLSKKIEHKKYSTLGDITDLVGIRIITYLEDDVDSIAEIIKNEFKVDEINSIDKRILETDRFGYRSLHVVVSLSSEREKLTENLSFKEIKAEIQIRTILQHAWAEIEHGIGYKGEYEIPDFAKRTFSRIAALLETADVELLRLKNDLINYVTELPKNIEEKPESVSLDKASLANYIEESTIVKIIESEMSDLTGGYGFESGKGDIGLYLTRLNYFNVQTIKELDILLHKYRSTIPLFYKEFFGKNESPFPQGLSIFYVSYILAAKDGDINVVKDFFIAIYSNKARDYEPWAEKIIDIYRNISITENR